jgi:hypothetical protein
MISQLPVTLLSVIACVALANVLPADPTITPLAVLPRQLDAAWIGWVKDNETCMHSFVANYLRMKPDRLEGLHNSAMLATHGTNLVSKSICVKVRLSDFYLGDYAQCCAETLTACPAPTACVRGSQIYPFSGTTITTAW